MAVVVIGDRLDAVIDTGQACLRAGGGCSAWTGAGNEAGFKGAVAPTGEADQLHG